MNSYTKFVYIGFLVALLFFGCIGGQEQPGTGDESGSNFSSGEDNGDDETGDSSNGGTGDDDDGGSDTEGVTPDYLVTTNIVQYSREERIADNTGPYHDNIEKAYGIQIDISDVSGGIADKKPIENPENAIVKLVGPSETITIPYGLLSQEEFSTLPSINGIVIAYLDWFNPSWPDTTTSPFVLIGVDEGLLAGGSYKLTIDTDGDGTVDGEKTIIIPGVTFNYPIFGTKAPETGFTLDWNQAGNPADFGYAVSFGQGWNGLDHYLLADESTISTELAITPTDYTLDPGMYAYNFQLYNLGESAMSTEASNYLYTGKADGKVVFYITIIKEAYYVDFKVGDFCHCEDLFVRTGPCTIDEIFADPLCSE